MNKENSRIINRNKKQKSGLRKRHSVNIDNSKSSLTKRNGQIAEQEKITIKSNQQKHRKRKVKKIY